jgi:hypothetical protein
MTNDKTRMTKQMPGCHEANNTGNLRFVIRHPNFVIVSLFEISLSVIPQPWHPLAQGYLATLRAQRRCRRLQLPHHACGIKFVPRFNDFTILPAHQHDCRRHKPATGWSNTNSMTGVCRGKSDPRGAFVTLYQDILDLNFKIRKCREKRLTKAVELLEANHRLPVFAQALAHHLRRCQLLDRRFIPLIPNALIPLPR